MSDYFKIVDLNPPIGPGPIIDPRDPRALCYFGFLAQGQHLSLGSFVTTPNLRIFYSFEFDYVQSTNPPPPPPPPGTGIKASGVLASGGPPLLMEAAYGENHDRRHVILWVDPTSLTPPPPPGQPIEVYVRAWSRE
jgi:hypothetical protein